MLEPSCDEFAFSMPRKLSEALELGIIRVGKEEIILNPGEAEDFLNYFSKYQVDTCLTFETIFEHLNRFRRIQTGQFILRLG